MSRIRIVADPNYRGTLADDLQTHLSRRSLNAARCAYAEAMNAAQVFETGIALLVLSVQQERTEQKTLKELADLHGYLFKRPLGHLIKLLQKEIPIPPQIEEELTKALEARNLIAHRYFKERLFEWVVPWGLKKITKELKEIKMTFELLSQKLDLLEDALCSKSKRERQQFKEQVMERFEREILPALVKVYAAHKQISQDRARVRSNKTLKTNI